MFLGGGMSQIKETFIRECLSKPASHLPARRSVLSSASVKGSGGAFATNKQHLISICFAGHQRAH